MTALRNVSYYSNCNFIVDGKDVKNKVLQKLGMDTRSMTSSLQGVTTKNIDYFIAAYSNYLFDCSDTNSKDNPLLFVICKVSNTPSTLWSFLKPFQDLGYLRQGRGQHTKTYSLGDNIIHSLVKLRHNSWKLQVLNKYIPARDKMEVLNCRNFKGYTPLEQAAKNGSREKCKVLINMGAEINGCYELVNRFKSPVVYSLLKDQQKLEDECDVLPTTLLQNNYKSSDSETSIESSLDSSEDMEVQYYSLQ